MKVKLEVKEIMKLLHPLSVNSKLEIISKLTNELKADLSDKEEDKAEYNTILDDYQKDVDEKAIIEKELKEAIENLKLIRQGKLKARPAKSLLNEL